MIIQIEYFKQNEKLDRKIQYTAMMFGYCAIETEKKNPQTSNNSFDWFNYSNALQTPMPMIIMVIVEAIILFPINSNSLIAIGFTLHHYSIGIGNRKF